MQNRSARAWNGERQCFPLDDYNPKSVESSRPLRRHGLDTNWWSANLLCKKRRWGWEAHGVLLQQSQERGHSCHLGGWVARLWVCWISATQARFRKQVQRESMTLKHQLLAVVAKPLPINSLTVAAEFAISEYLAVVCLAPKCAQRIQPKSATAAQLCHLGDPKNQHGNKLFLRPL